jgi:hypothetical protein
MIGQGIRWARHVESVGKNKVNWEGPKEKGRLRRPKHRWTLKMDHKP